MRKTFAYIRLMAQYLVMLPFIIRYSNEELKAEKEEEDMA